MKIKPDSNKLALSSIRKTSFSALETTIFQCNPHLLLSLEIKDEGHFVRQQEMRIYPHIPEIKKSENFPRLYINFNDLRLPLKPRNWIVYLDELPLSKEIMESIYSYLFKKM